MSTYTGLVVRTAERYVFDNDEGHVQQRLTRAVRGEDPGIQEIDLSPYENQRLRVEGEWEHEWIIAVTGISSDEPAQGDPFVLREGAQPPHPLTNEVHVLKKGIICDTEPRGHVTPQGRSPLDIVLDASNGFIPLWAPDTTLRWRFRERSLAHFANPTAAKNEIRRLFGQALLAWGAAAPVKFTEDLDLWDFEIVVRQQDECDNSGCVLASAFFPDAGRHEFVVYPMMFTQSPQEQIDTFTHETGHIFGLRHFFALLQEQAWPAQIFGTHDKFSIMNYGNLSQLTDADRSDLIALYTNAWGGKIRQINGTPIRFVKPYSATASSSGGAIAIASASA